MKKIKLKDVLDIKRGTSLGSEYYSSSGEYIRLTLGNFSYPENGFKQNKSKDDIFYTGKVKSNFILEKGDIITPLTEQVRGLLGNTAFIPESNKYIQSGDIGKVIPFEDKLDKTFAYYLVSSPIVKKQLDAGSQQTKIRHTSPDKIKDCISWIPDMPQQKLIGNLLLNIDSIINANSLLNQKIYDLLRTIFNYWFIQYDFPNDSNNPYKSNGGKLKYDDKLKVYLPESWNVGSLNDICKQVNGYAFSTDDFVKNGKYKLYTIKNVQDDGISINSDDYLDNIPNNMNNECFLKPNDLIMSLTGNVGRVGIVFENNVLLNQRVLKLIEENCSKEYLYCLLTSEHNRKRFEQMSTGTSQKNLSPVDLSKMLVVIPDKATLNKFREFTSGYINRITINNRKNLELYKLKEFLIPLFMNGQIKYE